MCSMGAIGSGLSSARRESPQLYRKKAISTDIKKNAFLNMLNSLIACKIGPDSYIRYLALVSTGVFISIFY